MRRSVALGVLMYFPGVARCQSPRAANPERPTFATHAYVVAPGYVELEQGVRVQGAGDLSDATAWDYNLKIGLARRVQLAFFGTAFMRTAAGVGPGDLGTTLKLSTGVSTRTTVALAASVTFPTGDASAGRGAGGTQGAVLAVASVDTPWRIHLDLNLGPVALGRGGSPLRWFHSLSAAIGAGRYGFTGEAYGYSAGAGEAAQWGALGAVTVRLAQWAVVDAGGSVGLWRDTPDLAFVGLTTNIGRVFR
ncbi:MAG TPA: hypothetical protein VEM13_04660 [Gemmatimonadales bacterium]|nr:hypothetical protein [Gemmatimonadales bacterium]